MKMNKIVQAISTLALAGMAIPAASADQTGWYIGANAGETQAEIAREEVVADLLDSGFTTTDFRTNDQGFGFRFFGGYQVNPYFALEGGYFDLNDFGYTLSTSPVGRLDGELEFSGRYLDVVGTLPLTQSLSLIGRAGAHRSEADVDYAASGTVSLFNTSYRKKSTNYKVGLGLQYAVNDNVDLRLEAERYQMDDAVGNDGELDMFSVGLVYRFGRAAPVAAAPARSEPVAEAPPRQPAPAPAPRPAPAPEPEPEPEPAPLIQVSFSADSLSTFDSSVIRAQGIAELDEFVDDLRGVDFETIVITGHTDRIGSDVYNRQLSQERADVVKEYLVRTGNIDPSKINARGVGSSRPVTTSAQCGDQLSRPQLIVCLAPDRRVEVEVHGTRQRQ
ncbi:MAG: outer membrane beta-barrel protein [Natronospirillum sp.]